MLFQEALEMLKQGKNVSRAAWSREDGYLVLLTSMKHVWKILTYPGPNAGNHIFNVDELSADDWQEYDAAAFEPKAEEAPSEELSCAA